MSSWRPREPKWPWRDFLTEEEADMIRDLDRTLANARYDQIQASMIRNPIVNRAIHRAKYAALKDQK